MAPVCVEGAPGCLDRNGGARRHIHLRAWLFHHESTQDSKAQPNGHHTSPHAYDDQYTWSPLEGPEADPRCTHLGHLAYQQRKGSLQFPHLGIGVRCKIQTIVASLQMQSLGSWQLRARISPLAMGLTPTYGMALEEAKGVEGIELGAEVTAAQDGGHYARWGEAANQRRGEHAGVHLGTRRV